MFRYISTFALASVLVACAYTTEGSIHELTVRTPGAEGSLCNVYVEKLRYQFRPPETRRIIKSKEDLVVDCFAPGNRHKKVVIESGITPATAFNVPTGPVGFGWDYASNAMFEYPDVVEVNFTDTLPQPAELPWQNRPDIAPPESYDLEEFLPGNPRLNSDRYRTPIVPQPRTPGGAFGLNESSMSDEYSSGGAYEGTGTIPPTVNRFEGGKGDLESVIQRTGAVVTNGVQREPEDAVYGPAPTAVTKTTTATPTVETTAAPAAQEGESAEQAPVPLTLKPADFAPDLPMPGSAPNETAQ